MAEGIVTDLMKQLVSITARQAEQEIRLVVGIDEEVQKLESNLQTVKAVLSDAEKRKVTDETVKLWLEKLKDTCYEMDDVVDEWNIAMIKSEIQKEEENAENAPVVMKKVCSFIPSTSCCFHQVDKLVLRHDIGHKIKELNGKLDEIVRERGLYGFELTTKGNNSEVVERPKTTSFVDVSEICGRDKVRDDLVSILLGKKGSEEEKSPFVISLVGMGGIGKTTLAQLAYNDPKVKAHFENRIWVCVSEPFDQCRVAKGILEALGGGHPNITELQNLLEKICELIGEKKFFLVLDDVWTEDSTLWEPFRLALKYSAQGSRILVTTRKSKVAEMMGSTSAHMINLEVLSEEECWLVFSKIAFCTKDPEQCVELEDLGRQIAKKCKGLPLAAKSLGSLMRFMRSREQWKNVLDSNLWELEDVEKVVEKDLFAPLLLSYNDLPSPLKQCFSLCAIFPKDYEFHTNDLIFMWVAHGYIDSKENMEIIGREYFENLAIRSFFQDFQKYDDDDDNDEIIFSCKMHDIVHDFAQSMTKNECFTINSVIEPRSNYRNAHHLHLEIPEQAQFPVFIYNIKNLRTLILKFPMDYNLSSLFQHFRCLRTLSLNFLYGKSKELPDAVENFMHLRYLKLFNYNGDGLPETIYNLCNLQVLEISFQSPRFKKFPQGMGKLINLRHFILSSYSGDNWFELPRGIGRLTSLRTLNFPFFISGKDDSKGCNLGELKNLNHLRGTLQIKGLGNVVDVYEVENAQLKKKIHLRNLELWFDGEYEERMENDAFLLNAIEPPPNLEYLHIGKYRATTMSLNSMMFVNTKLKRLHLRNLENLENLPLLGKLSFLESLAIVSLSSLKKVGVEFLGINSENKRDDKVKIFPNLKSLWLQNLKEWEEWIGIGGMREEEENCITIMPRLQHLTIFECPKLKLLPDFLLTTPLETLEITNSLILENRYQRGTGEDWPKISHIPNIEIDWQYVQEGGQELNT